MTNAVKRRAQDALSIWRAGVDAVDSKRLVRDCCRPYDDGLEIKGRLFLLEPGARIVVVGAGKAGAGMAAGFEAAVAGSALEERVTGWINVPADCVNTLKRIHLHAARPAGVNEPTEAGVEGSLEILRLVSELSPRDLCVVLLSGGASALMPAPLPDISLADKQAVTRFLMEAGATINELNCVRKHLSQIKGGKLARAAGDASVVTLIISDVVGDPLDVIASGPTVDDTTTSLQAIAILSRFDANRRTVPSSVWTALRAQSSDPPPPSLGANVTNLVIGNNATALAAAEKRAAQIGYTVQSLGSEQRGIARDVGRDLAHRLSTLRDQAKPGEKVCVLVGGEPIVRLAHTDRPRLGGRNQEVALAALAALWKEGMDGITLLSAGTDGEDGPTDAAGAIVDQEVHGRARELNCDPQTYLAINNSYIFFDRVGGLFRTGPTNTNVMDLRVGLVEL